jgi:hypothetical protein
VTQCLGSASVQCALLFSSTAAAVCSHADAASTSGSDGRACLHAPTTHHPPPTSAPPPPSVTEAEGLKRKLSSALSPASHHLHINWDVGECVGTWWRPNFDTLLYPYVPPHITRPKECQKIFVVPLPEKACFQVGGGALGGC